MAIFNFISKAGDEVQAWAVILIADTKRTVTFNPFSTRTPNGLRSATVSNVFTEGEDERSGD